MVGFDIVDEDPRHDLALLKLRRNPFSGERDGGIVIGGEALEPLHGVPSLRVERPRDGDPVTVSGHPLAETVLITNTGIVASSWGVNVDELPHPEIADLTIPQMRDTYLADVQTNPGNSGGPVYSSEDGAVVGVLVAGKQTSVLLAGKEPVTLDGTPLTADAGISLIVPAKYVVEMLERHGVAWTPA